MLISVLVLQVVIQKDKIFFKVLINFFQDKLDRTAMENLKVHSWFE